MAFESAQHHRRLQRATQRMTEGVAKLYSRTCRVCAAAAGPDGRCTTCHREVAAPAPAVQQSNPEPSPDEIQAAAQRAFWARYERESQEREQNAQSRGSRSSMTVREALEASKPSRADVLREKFMTSDGRLREM
jgi:hypothetical protein